MDDSVTISDRLRAARRTAGFRPVFTLAIIFLSTAAASFEAVGLSFLIPIIEITQNGGVSGSSSNIIEVFAFVYDFIGIPLTLETVIVGAGMILTLRYTLSFIALYLKTVLSKQYTNFLRTEAFNAATEAEVSYFDENGSDEILNVIITQTQQGGGVINILVNLVKIGMEALAYSAITVYIAPVMTIGSGILLVLIVIIARYVVDSGYQAGDRVADAHEGMQEVAQSGTQGIRDVKIFNMNEEIKESFQSISNEVARSQINLNKNSVGLSEFYNLATALAVFALIYASLELLSLDIASLGVFMFAVFRLAPRVSTLNNNVYKLESALPHLVRTQDFIDELVSRSETRDEAEQPSEIIDKFEFDEVDFSYNEEETVLENFSLSIDRGEFVAAVGPSGAGKSTLVSLITRMYEPDDGKIRANGTPIDQFDINEWRKHVSVVRQNPFIFNDTLRRNVTIGNRNATQSEIEQVCAVAQVTEFLDDLPERYDTILGDDGVRLSGGQRQRVALARALLTGADLLVLDEATSDLDSNIEETVHQAIESMDRNYAMLVIAHRLSTVVNADCIYTMEDGTITEAGTHRTLLEQDGLYADLYSTQTQAM